MLKHTTSYVSCGLVWTTLVLQCKEIYPDKLIWPMSVVVTIGTLGFSDMHAALFFLKSIRHIIYSWWKKKSHLQQQKRLPNVILYHERDGMGLRKEGHSPLFRHCRYSNMALSFSKKKKKKKGRKRKRQYVVFVWCYSSWAYNQGSTLLTAGDITRVVPYLPQQPYQLWTYLISILNT